MTGDDAIACAYRESQHSGSHSLGVSLRVTSYSGVTDAHAQRLSRLLCALAAGVGAELVAVPISHVPGESDLEAFVRMFPGRNTPALSPAFRMTPEWIRDEIGRCRVVITGAYHTAVFALSQGIPAVCLANSQYYLDKFLGLAAQFEQGCQVIRLDAPDSEAAIKRATEDVWHKCDLYRKPLLSAALKQIRESERAWANLPSVLSQRGCIQRVCSRQPQDSKSSETG